MDAAHPFAQIRNEENCLLIETVQSDSQHVWTGRGAGRWPTTAAVMADFFDIARELRTPKQLCAISSVAETTRYWPTSATDN